MQACIQNSIYPANMAKSFAVSKSLWKRVMVRNHVDIAKAYCTRKNMCTDENSSSSLDNDKNSNVRPTPKRNRLSATSRLSEMMLDEGIHLHDTKSKDNIVSSVDSCDNSSQIKDIERSPGDIINPIKYDPSNPRSTKNMSFLKSIDAESTDTSSISSGT